MRRTEDELLRHKALQPIVSRLMHRCEGHQIHSGGQICIKRFRKREILFSCEKLKQKKKTMIRNDDDDDNYNETKFLFLIF